MCRQVKCKRQLATSIILINTIASITYNSNRWSLKLTSEDFASSLTPSMSNRKHVDFVDMKTFHYDPMKITNFTSLFMNVGLPGITI